MKDGKYVSLSPRLIFSSKKGKFYYIPSYNNIRRSIIIVHLIMRARQKSKMVPAAPVPVEVIPENRQEKIHYFLQKVEDRVVGLIDAQSVKIAPQKIPFVQAKKDEADTIALRLKKMQANKDAIQSKLYAIAEEEQQLKLKHRQLQKLGSLQGKCTARDGKQSESIAVTLRPRSELSTEDINLLKKLKKEHKDFEKSLDEKTRTHNQALEKIRREEQELEEKKRQQEGEAKRKEIAKKLQILQRQRSDREKQFQQQKRKLIEVKAKKKLFEQAERLQREKEKADLQKKVALMQSRMKQKELDLQSIRSHEEKYREIKEQQRANRQKRKEQFDEIVRQRRQQESYQKSKYYTIAHQQTRKRKQQQLQKQREKLELIEAGKMYAQQIKQDYSPRVKTKSSEKEEEKKAEGLSFEEIKDLGNNYMSQMRKLIKKRQNGNESKLTSKDTTLPLKLDPNQSNTTSTKYRDYLSERRMLRPASKMNQTEDRIKDRLIRRDLEDVYRIMNSKQDRGDKLDRVKNIAQKLDVKQKGDDHQMIDKISAKLKILETLADSH